MTVENVINRYFAAMRQGTEGAQELFELFADDAVYIEPFTGEDPAVGIDAIRRRFALGWETELPDLEIDVLEIRVDGPSAWTSWECRSPGLPGPVQGEDLYEVADGRIVRLEVKIVGRHKD